MIRTYRSRFVLHFGHLDGNADGSLAFCFSAISTAMIQEEWKFMSEKRNAHISKEKPQTKLQIPKEAKALELINQELTCICKNLFNF